MAIKTGWATALSAIIGALKNRGLSRGFQPSANGGVKNRSVVVVCRWICDWSWFMFDFVSP